MKLRAIATALTSFAAAWLLAQTPSSVPAQPEASPGVVAQINRDLNVRKLKAADRITAKVLQDLVLGGKIVIPRNSKLIGRVAEAQATSQADSVARLALVFERVDLKDGGTLSLHGVIQALAPPMYDPFLEGIMASSSPYAGPQSGHPATGGTGQSNVPTPTVSSDPRKSGAAGLEQRKQGLEDAGKRRPSGPQGPRGALMASSHGVFGYPGLTLRATEPVPVLVSVGHNIDLEKGTQIVLRLGGPLSAPASR
jgi:hypothetical protein